MRQMISSPALCIIIKILTASFLVKKYNVTSASSVVFVFIQIMELIWSYSLHMLHIRGQCFSMRSLCERHMSFEYVPPHLGLKSLHSPVKRINYLYFHFYLSSTAASRNFPDNWLEVIKTVNRNEENTSTKRNQKENAQSSPLESQFHQS